MSVDTSPAALAEIRVKAEAEDRREGWKSAAFGFYSDAVLVLALLDELEKARREIVRFADSCEKLGKAYDIALAERDALKDAR